MKKCGFIIVSLSLYVNATHSLSAVSAPPTHSVYVHALKYLSITTGTVK